MTVAEKLQIMRVYRSLGKKRSENHYRVASLYLESAMFTQRHNLLVSILVQLPLYMTGNIILLGYNY